jgi:sulfite exporter TauE/SafE
VPSLVDLVAMAGLGFFGTGHCIGMCGPLVLAVPARAGGIAAQLLYHTGRIATYTIIGGIAGGVGSGLGQLGGMADIAAAQAALSVVAALVLALFAVVRIGLLPEPRWMSGPSPTRLPGYDGVSRRAAKSGGPALFLWGMMLGTLPCGLSYAAFARTLPSGGLVPGALLVLAFGLGTLPGLLFLGTAGSRFFARHRKLSDIISGAVMAGMAVALLADALGALT